MGYLRYRDYMPTIQDGNFQQVLQSIPEYRIATEARTQAQMISYLVQKYDTESEFTDTTVFSPTATYGGASLVYFDYPVYSATNTYTLGTCIVQASQAYICTTAITSPEAFDPSHWQLLGQQYDLLYISLPYPLFSAKSVYLPGDRVFWRGKVYQCLIGTHVPDHTQIIQAGSISSIVDVNVFPDDRVNGVTYWGNGVTYSVSGLIPNAPLPAAWSSSTAYMVGNRVLSGGVLWRAIANSTDVEPGADITTWQSEQWIPGDNRSQQLVEYMVAITIYKLSSRIAPRNVPQHWIDKYNEAIAWLQMAADGSVTAAVPEKQPAQGARIRFGGKPKLDNSY